MMIRSYLIAAILVLLMLGCRPDPIERVDPYGQVAGTWTVQSFTSDGTWNWDGQSTITFENCDEPPCTGTTWNSMDGTTNTFSYTLSADERLITITNASDTSGLELNGTWNIPNYSERSMFFVDVEQNVVLNQFELWRN